PMSLPKVSLARLEPPVLNPALNDGGMVRRSYSVRPQLVQRIFIPCFRNPLIMLTVGSTAARPLVAAGDRSGCKKKFCMSMMTRAVRLGSILTEDLSPIMDSVL